MNQKMRQGIQIETTRGTLLDGVLFHNRPADSVLIAITGIHGNFYSNPFYYLIGDTLADNGFDFIYAQTTDAFGQMVTFNNKTGEQEIVGSYNESFDDTDDDVEAYIRYAANKGYKHIYLAGHSLGANKVIHYLANHPDDKRIEKFLLLSPANVDYMTAVVSQSEKRTIERMIGGGQGEAMLPFPLLGWIQCTANTAWQWVFSGTLNNTHTSDKGDFSQAEHIHHTGALLIGTYDNFTEGSPENYLRLLNSHMPTADSNELIFIERTGHTYQQKEQELTDDILALMKKWVDAALNAVLKNKEERIKNTDAA